MIILNINSINIYNIIKCYEYFISICCEYYNKQFGALNL